MIWHIEASNTRIIALASHTSYREKNASAINQLSFPARKAAVNLWMLKQQLGMAVMDGLKETIRLLRYAADRQARGQHLKRGLGKC